MGLEKYPRFHNFFKVPVRRLLEKSKWKITAFTLQNDLTPLVLMGIGLGGQRKV